MDSTSSNALSKALRYWIYALFFLLAGAMVIHQTGIDQRTLGGSRIYFKATHFDAVHLLLQIIFLMYLGIQLEKPLSPSRLPSLFSVSQGTWLLGLLTLLLIGFWGFVKAYPFAPDEWATLFQSQIFLHGLTAAPIPLAYQSLGEALTPTMILHHAESHSWSSFYLPIHTLLFSAFEYLHIGWFLNPLFTLLTALLLLQIHAVLWPERRESQSLILVILVAFPQILCMAMSYFSMSSHLFFNALWLRIYLSKSSARGWLLPVSFLALGLHNPLIHSLFVAPFLIRWFFTLPRFLPRVFLTLFYLLSTAFWMHYWMKSNSLFEHHTAMVGLPNALTLIHQICHGILLASWSFPLLGVGLALLLITRPKIPPFFQDLAWGLLLTLLCYFCFTFSHGRGWGYRYAHGILANIILLALFGFYSLPLLSLAHLHRLFASSFIFVVVLIYPLKMAEIRFEIEPFRQANQALYAFPTPFIILHPLDAWYANDLFRNDPFLATHPLRLNADRLTENEIKALVDSGKAIRLTPDFYRSHHIPLLKSVPTPEAP